MKYITIDANGIPSLSTITVGNQWENLDETIQFSFPENFAKLYKYVVARTYKKDTKENITRVFPLTKNKLVIGSSITCIPGTWYLYTLCKSSEVNLDTKTIDLRAQEGEHISISDAIIARVNANDIDAAAIENIEIDPNIKILYDELFDFKAELENNEAARQTNESLRKQAEVLRINAETERAEAESDRNNTEIIRVDNENARKQAEAERVTNENQRIKSEQSRKSAESSRVSAESTRIEVEKTRVNAESQRATVETSRVSAEAKRVDAEKARANAESQRTATEASRVSAETKRADAEKARANAESQRTATEASRVSAESNRSSAERQRAEAETSRINAEQSRSDNEVLRVNAENERVTAENARQEAETKREGVITKLREDLDNNTKADEKTNRSLTALWDLNKGISYRFENDNEKAYTKTVPSGAKIGAVNKIGGKTIVYNQLFTEETTGNNGVTATYIDNVITLNGTATQSLVNLSRMTSAMNVVGKFYFKVTILKNDDNVGLCYGWLNRSVKTDVVSSGSASIIYNQTDSDLKLETSTGFSGFEVGTVFNDVKSQIIIVNLTKMFGEGNEPSTVEEFESMFPNSYYTYNEGKLMSMSVNEVEEVGKNIFKCEHFSCYALNGTNKPNLSNSYGTSINSIEPSNSVTVTQSKVAQEDAVVSYENGYFCVSFKPLTMNGKYVFSFDITPSNKLISSPKFMVLFNGNANYGSAIVDVQSLQIGTKSKLFFTLNVNNKKVKYIEIRNSGISGIFENFQIEEGSTNTTFSPYHENHYAIPQAILGLDGYGASGNYVDFAKKEYHKGNEIIDISDIIGDTFQEPIDVESGGSLTFKNVNGDGYKVAVPSDVQYVVSLSEANS